MPQLSFSKASAAASRGVVLGELRGVDLTSGALGVAPQRSPDAPNMMPDGDGRPKKRPGFATIEEYGGEIFGAYSLVNGSRVIHLVHAGDKLYADGQLVFTGMAEAPSSAVQMAHAKEDNFSAPMLWIIDGSCYRCFDGETVRAVSSMATVPLVTISKNPNGLGGVSFLPVNLLTGWVTDSFRGVASTKDYFLSFTGLTSGAVKVEKMNDSGIFVPMTSGFTVDRALGKVSFTAAPGVSPVTGEDNIRITYEKGTNGADKINRCRIATLFGIRGTKDRVFLAGHPDEVNIDRWSEFYDPTYFGDLQYGMVGKAGNPIVGYSQVGNRLVTHKRDEEGGSNAVVRVGELGVSAAGMADYALFTLENTLQGAGAVGQRSIGQVANEPLFLTRQGVFAMTATDVTGERFMQSRSYYLNGALLREDLEKASCAVFGRFYALAAGGKLYLLDTAQKYYEPDSPHSTFQYEGYVWTGIDAALLFVRLDPASGEETLCFGTADGRVCAFKKGDAAGDYNDNGAAIACHWTTPLLHLGSYARRKTITGVWVAGKPYGAASVDYLNEVGIVGTAAFGGEGEGVELLDYSGADPYALTMAGGMGVQPEILPHRQRAKKVKLFAVRVGNDALDEGFGLDAIQIEYRMSGKIR